MSEVVQRTVDDVQTIAESMGLTSVLPRDEEVFLDYDGPTADNDLIVIERVLRGNEIHILSRLDTVSKGGQGVHVYLRLDRPIIQLYRIALQACMGSDSVKEALSLIRCMEGHPQAAVALFETDSEYIRVVRWRAKLDGERAQAEWKAAIEKV